MPLRLSRYALGLTLLAVGLLLAITSPTPRETTYAASNASMIAAGAEHTCALITDGAIRCWGDNTWGALGDGTTTERHTPVSVCATGTWNGSACTGSALTGATWITAGAGFTCAAMTGGGAKCWGLNSNGQLGDGTTSTRLNPADVCTSGSWNGSACSGSALTGVVRITNGQVDTCALMTSTGVKCWGNNSNGNLGDGTLLERHKPVDVCASGTGAGCSGGSALTGVTLVGTGGAHHCAIISGGVKCWGYNFDGELGDGNMPTISLNPVDVLNNTLTTPDSGGVGDHGSLALDASGNPVISYRDNVNGDLRLMHCNDRSCAGDDESSVSPDTGGDVGRYTSLALDAGGNPVVSYSDSTNGDLKVLHCNEANCAAGGDSITSPDTGGNVGGATSLALDASGNPVVSYYDTTNGDLKVLHCNDANCAGGDESIVSPDTGGVVGLGTSLALDASGNPLVGYYDTTNGDLKVLHCDDANCAAGGDSITSPDTAGSVGLDPSLALDASGNPVISYRNGSSTELKVMHCNDTNCSGGGESITSPDTAGSVGQYTSLALDANGYPVVSYHDSGNGDLKVLHCNDANCAAGGDTITSPDTGGVDIVGQYTSLALDASGNPVVSYYDFDNGNVKVLHCGDANCSSLLGSVSWLAVGEFHNCALVTGGEARCWGDNLAGQLGNANAGVDSDRPVAVCADETCATNLTGAILAGAGGNESCVSMPGYTGKCWGEDDFGELGDGLPLTNSDTPRNVCADPACSGPLSNVASGGADLGVHHACGITTDGNVICTGHNDKGQLGDGTTTDRPGPVQVTGLSSKTGDTPMTVDSTGDVGQHASLVLDASGFPVVSYYDATNGDLKVLHCGNAACTSGNTIATPDTTGDVGSYTSIGLVSGNPVVAYYDATNADLKFLSCGNSTCTSGNTASALDATGSVGRFGSMKVDGTIPVIAYYDFTNAELELLRCGNSACSAGNSFATPDPSAIINLDGSISLSLIGSNPVVSYYHRGSDDLRVLQCGNSTCTAGNSIASPDTGGSVGAYNSIEVDASGNPVITYSGPNSELKVMHCGNAGCTSANVATAPGESGSTAVFTSVALDAAGSPVVSFGGGIDSLYLMHCGTNTCSGGNTIASPDGEVALYSSLALDSSGVPTLAYYDGNSLDLKVLHCNDANCSGAAAPPPVVAFVGTGSDGDCASGPATTCAIDGPRGMYADGLITYLADGDNCRVKRIEGGLVSTVAGLGQANCAFTNGSSAATAKLNHPNDVFLEGTDLYIADTDNCVVRKVDLSLGTPTISTVAGQTGVCTSVDGSTGTATINKPAGVAYLGGALYVAERDGCKIRKVQGGSVSTVAGTGTCGDGGDGGPAASALLDHPTDVAPMRPGFGLLIADRDSDRVRFINLLNGVITTIAGTGSAGFSGDGGPATSAKVSGPEAVDSADGQILIADTQNDRVRVVNTYTNVIRTLMGSGGLLPGITLNEPRSVATTGLGVELAGGSVASSQPGIIKAGFVRACSFQTPTLCYEVTISGVDQYGDNTFTNVPATSCSVVPGSAGSIDFALPVLLVGLLAFRKRFGAFFIMLRSALGHSLVPGAAA